MNWQLKFSGQAKAFADKHNIYDKVKELALSFIFTLINRTPPTVDVKKLKGVYRDYFRIRLGKDYRIIVLPNYKERTLHISRIDTRDKAYRK